MPTVTEKIHQKTLSTAPSEILEIYNVLCIVWVMDMFDCVERSKNTF